MQHKHKKPETGLKKRFFVRRCTAIVLLLLLMANAVLLPGCRPSNSATSTPSAPTVPPETAPVTDPIIPTDPTVPTAPTETVPATDPAVPTVPAETVPATNPTIPTDPTVPTVPAETVPATNPTIPTDPTVPTVPGEPASVPELTIRNGEQVLLPTVTAYDWSYIVNETGQHFVKEHRSPMSADVLPTLPDLSSNVIGTKLEFSNRADSKMVRCWPVPAPGEEIAYDQYEIVTIRNQEIQLKEGHYIYEIEAQWYVDAEGYGTVYYAFAANCTSTPVSIEKSLTITCGQQTVSNPWECVVTQKVYDDAGHDWLSDGGLSGYYTLLWNTSVVTIPEMTLIGNLQLHMRENGTLEQISVYKRLANDEIAFAGNKASLSDLAALPEGPYYLVLSVNWKGRYIQEQDAYESCQSDYLVALNVPDKGEPKLQWQFDEQTGTLTVFGVEIIPDFSAYNRDERPWNAICDQVIHLVVANGTKRIGNDAFYEFKNLQSVTLPEGLEEIGEYAFSHATSLPAIHFPDSLKTIGIGAFYFCQSLQTLTLPINIKTVANSAFSYCQGLKEVTIYGSPKEIINSFSYCSGLEIIRFCGDYPQGAYYSLPSYEDFVVYYPGNNSTWPEEFLESESYHLLWVASDDPASETVIPPDATAGPCGRNVRWSFANGVLTISGSGNWHYYPWTKYVDQIKKVVLSPGLTNIASFAFSGCANLEEINIPESVVDLGSSCFKGCSSLRSIDLPEGLNILGGAAFSGCASLKSIHIPDGVTVIEGNTFRGCKALTSVTLPSGLTEIGDSAFYGCTALRKLTFPATLTSLGDHCFVGCSKLKELYFYGDPPAVRNFTFNQLTLTAYYPAGNEKWESGGIRNPTGHVIEKPDPNLAVNP